MVGLELAVHAADRPGLAVLHGDEGDGGGAHEDEVGQQVLERERVARDGLADIDLLDAAHVTDLPVVLGAVRVRVVAVDAGLLHDHRGDQAHAVAEGGPRSDGDQLVRLRAQRRERFLLEVVENVGRAVLEGLIGHEAVVDVLLLVADHFSELERHGRRIRNGPGDRLDSRAATWVVPGDACTWPTTLLA